MPKKRKIVLNGKRMDTRVHAHAHIKRRMKLPKWYGGNLDALCDCLGEINEPTVILLRHAERLKRRLGDYGARLITVLSAMTGENKNIELEIHNRF
jgi:ribonuclease inhibitor